MLNQTDKLFSPQEVASTLNVAYMTVYRWIRSGTLKAYQISKQYRIKPADLNDFLKKARKNWLILLHLWLDLLAAA
jgi:excisionase family DNA binding protein